MNFEEKKITIMGLGILGGGVGTAKYFCEQGARVMVTDLKPEVDLKKSIRMLDKYDIKFIFGKHREEDFIHADLIIKNPAVPSNSRFLMLARKHHIPVEMAESLFMKLSPTQNIIGITGTRGKSTTSTLIYEILKQAGKDVYMGGNVRDVSTLSLLGKITEKSTVILELSSWQLESFGWYHLSPHIAVITNIYQDHLNRYNSMTDYIADKENIYKFQTKKDYLILNNESKIVSSFLKKAQGKVVFFDKLCLPVDVNLRLPGEHNRENAAAALKVTKLYGINEGEILRTISSFKGLPNRLEIIGEINGVRFINDTTSTTPIAGIMAIRSFPNNPIVLISGGNSKNIPLDTFVSEIKDKVKYTVLFDGNALAEFSSLKNVSTPIPIRSMYQAVKQALSHAQKGNIILFSPGVTHLPIINEFDRGEAFNNAFKKAKKLY